MEKHKKNKEIEGNRRKKKEKNRGAYVLYAFITLICLFPLYFSVISSFKSTQEIFSNPFKLPETISFTNYVTAWHVGNMGRYFLNTLILTAASLALIVFVASMAAFVIARFRFRLQPFLLLFFVSGMMIPMQSVIIPLAFNLGNLHLKNNYAVLVLIFTAFQLPMSIFIYNGFMLGIPKELEEAARVDGCSVAKMYLDVILPLVKPAIVTSSIFNFINIWNNLLFPLVFITDKDKQVISYGLLQFFSQWKADYGGVMAGITLSIIPSLLIYIFMQEKVEAGMVAGAVKG